MMAPLARARHHLHAQARRPAPVLINAWDSAACALPAAVAIFVE